MTVDDDILSKEINNVISSPKERKRFTQKSTDIKGDSDKNAFIHKFAEDTSTDFNTDFLKEN